MKFKELAEYFDKLENTASRNEMVEILAQLFKKASPEEISFICYLLQGRVAPLFEPIEFGLADKMMIKAIARGYDKDEEEVNKLFQKRGDLGIVAQELAGKKSAMKDLNVVAVYQQLYELATSTGAGSVEKKVRQLSFLFKELDSLSVRFVVRIPLNKLRLGFSDMTMLDALSWMTTGDKSARKNIEAAYNVRPDLGFIAKTVKSLKVKEFKSLNVEPEVGTPILMARAERLVSPEEIIKKIGKCAVEYKYDGFRIQIHYSKDKQAVASKSGAIFSGVKNDSSKIGHDLYATPMALFEDLDQSKGYVRLFSRNLEDVTKMYPDIVKGVIGQIKVKSAIFEGEAIAFDPETHQFLPFQETVQRKRKYDIAQKAKDVPLKLIAFELLYVEGESLINAPYEERRKKLEKLF